MRRQNLMLTHIQFQLSFRSVGAYISLLNSYIIKVVITQTSWNVTFSQFLHISFTYTCEVQTKLQLLRNITKWLISTNNIFVQVQKYVYIFMLHQAEIICSPFPILPFWFNYTWVVPTSLFSFTNTYIFLWYHFIIDKDREMTAGEFEVIVRVKK